MKRKTDYQGDTRVTTWDDEDSHLNVKVLKFVGPRVDFLAVHMWPRADGPRDIHTFYGKNTDKYNISVGHVSLWLTLEEAEEVFDRLGGTLFGEEE